MERVIFVDWQPQEAKVDVVVGALTEYTNHHLGITKVLRSQKQTKKTGYITGLCKKRWIRLHLSSLQHVKFQWEITENCEWGFKDVTGKVELPENVKMVMPGDYVTAVFELISSVPLEADRI
uniref:Uncharacterized protein n=1 Tax=Nelumbo nucifera TaxID=4432 RepID=A0A822ZNT7_NELNU|nr:TPA_asm: hypothetical protein HUJ06_003421 [Nelumbo nucifera]